MLTLAALSACGGGGSTGGTPTATVTSTSVAATRYGASALVTINGTGLDSSLSVTSAGCKNMTLTTSTSTSTTAHYSCTVSGAYSSTVVAKSNGTTVGSAAFTVPAPVVTMAVSNGAGVNGNLVIALAGDKAPITVDNFLAYVNAGFYSGLIFHRISALNNVVQGGGYGATASSVAVAQSIMAAPCTTPLSGATDDSCVPIPNVVITSAAQTQ